jgi:glycosyltransferase involved in cell wall biosynthesis
MSGCTGTGKKIQILLSTYNGENFLEEQLDSYFEQQPSCQLSVLVRDDGSTDNTANILKKYAKKYGFSLIFGDNIGVNNSMEVLLHSADKSCDYFAISDQDDVWFPNKFSLAVSALNNVNDKTVALFASRSEIVDASLRHLGSSICPKRNVSYYNAMIQNVCPGHTMVFNRAMLDNVIKHGVGNAHVIDWWFYLVASSMGKVIFSDEYTVRHRQHGGNAVGYPTGAFSRVIRRIKNARSGKGNSISSQLKVFYDKYKSELPPDYREETEYFLESLISVRTRVSFATGCKVYRQSVLDTALFRILYVCGKYKFDEGT